MFDLISEVRTLPCLSHPMEDNEVKQKWLYLDTQQDRKGPLDENTIRRLLKRGIIKSTTYVWSGGMTDWQPIQDVPAFRSYVATLQKSWYYLVNGKQSDPVSTMQLVRLFLNGDLDGFSMIWGDGCVEWLPLGQVGALKEILQEANCEKEREEEAFRAQEAIADTEKVYADDG